MTKTRITIIALLMVAVLGAGMVTGRLDRIAHAASKPTPEPVTCFEFAVIGAQHVWKCPDPDNDVVCYANNVGFLQCVKP